MSSDVGVGENNGTGENLVPFRFGDERSRGNSSNAVQFLELKLGSMADDPNNNTTTRPLKLLPSSCSSPSVDKNVVVGC